MSPAGGAPREAKTFAISDCSDCKALTQKHPFSRIAAVAEDHESGPVRMRRLCGADTYIPLGPAANHVLVQKDDIVRAARELCGDRS